MGEGWGASLSLFLSHSTDELIGDGFVVTALTDAEYPRRSALSMCTSIAQEFAVKFPTARAPVAWPQLDQYLARCVAHFNGDFDLAVDCLFSYQDPTEADKLSKIQKDLDETKVPINVTD
jgi:synaptobrevin family protein YKT6